MILVALLAASLMLTACRSKQQGLVYDENDSRTWWYEGHTSLQEMEK